MNTNKKLSLIAIGIALVLGAMMLKATTPDNCTGENVRRMCVEN